MPLHDWSKLPEWGGVHHLWITELFHDIKSKLPQGYRAGVAAVPSLTIGAPPTHPDISVHRQASISSPAGVEPSPEEFSGEETEVTVLTLNPSKVLRVYRGSELVAVVELISPGNKDRDDTRQTTVDRIVGYLALGIHVMFVDVHPQPGGFSLADAIASTLDYAHPPCPAPHAMAYRVGNAPDGMSRSLTIRRSPLAIGEPLPTIAVSLTQSQRVQVDLESTYNKATSDYLSWLPSINGPAT